MSLAATLSALIAERVDPTDEEGRRLRARWTAVAADAAKAGCGMIDAIHVGDEE